MIQNNMNKTQLMDQKEENSNKPMINNDYQYTVLANIGETAVLKIAKADFTSPDGSSLKFYLEEPSPWNYQHNELTLVNEDNDYLYFSLDATTQNTQYEETRTLYIENTYGVASVRVRSVVGKPTKHQNDNNWDIVIAQNETGDQLTVGHYDSAYGGTGDDHFYLTQAAGQNNGQSEASFYGGAGNDTYYVQAGQTININDIDLNNRLILGEGLRKENMRIFTVGDQITFLFKDEHGEWNTKIRVHNENYSWDSGQKYNHAHLFSEIVFANGETMNGHDLGVIIHGAYPYYNGISMSMTYDQNGFFESEHPEVKDANDLDKHSGYGNGLRFISATIDGQPIPDWLILDEKTGQFSGQMPRFEDYTYFTVTVRTINDNGVEGYYDVELSFPANHGINRAPVIDRIQQDLLFEQNQSWQYTFSSLFKDPDRHIIYYDVKLSNGQPLPSWLRFNQKTNTLETIGKNAEGGIYELMVTGQDYYGLSASQTFILTIDAPNNAPIVTGDLPGYSIELGKTFSYTLPAGIIQDPDKGDRLTYQITMADGSALPDWLFYSETNGRIWGVPPLLEELKLIVTATDQKGLSASVPLTLTTKPVVHDIGDQTVIIGSAFNYDLGFAQNQQLSYHLRMNDGSQIPDWIQFDSKKGIISGTAQIKGSFTLEMVATDLAGNQFSYTINLTSTPETGMSYSEGNNYHNTLKGNAGSNFLNGLSGNDTLQGLAGNDRLMGGRGDDYLDGGEGSDIYIFSHNDGTDTINNYAADGTKTTDIIRFTDVKRNEASFIKQGNDLLIIYHRMGIEFNDTGVITVKNHFLGNTYKINQIEFTDEVLNQSQLDQLTSQLTNSILGTEQADRLTGTGHNDILYGFEGNDQLNGAAGNDTLIGGAGNDTLNGGAGSDQYLFEHGSGRDIINNYAADGRKTKDQIIFTECVSSEARYYRMNNDLIIVYSENLDDFITVKNHFVSELYAIKEVIFADRIFVLNEINALAQSVPNTIIGSDRNETLYGSTKDDVLYGLEGNDILAGGNGNDLLIGGTGNDTLRGETGHDTYRFSKNDGQDIIDNFAGDARTTHDNIVFTDISFNEAILRRQNNDLIILYNNYQDSVTVRNHFLNDMYQIDSVSFVDQTINTQQIIAQVNKSVTQRSVFHESAPQELNSLINAMAVFNNGSDSHIDRQLVDEFSTTHGLLSSE